MENLVDKVDMLSKTMVNENRKELSKQETNEAMKVLFDNKKLLFPREVKSTNDPVILGQEYGLWSFTPARDAKPNSNGLYGVFKLRGNFSTVDESEIYAERLIRTHDSYNEIHVVRIGQCVPLSTNPELVEEVVKVDLSKETDKIMSDNVREKRKQEKQEMKTIQEREQKLLKENKEILEGTYEQEPLEEYIMLRVKKAQLMWTLVEQRKRLQTEVIPNIKKVKDELLEWDKNNPTFKDLYYDRYVEARKSVGIEDQDKLNYSYFMKYLLDENDVPLD